MTGELRDTWEGIQRRLRGEHVHGCVSHKGARSAGGGDKLEGRCVCFDGVTCVGRAMEDLLVSIVPATFGLLWL